MSSGIYIYTNLVPGGSGREETGYEVVYILGGNGGEMHRVY